MAQSFKNLRIVDNFYQTSSFFPMPTVVIGTLCPDGLTNLGSYSLCFPYYVAGKDYYAMVLECRNSSNTAENLLRTGRCSINFIPDKRRDFKEAVRLGFPGDTPQEKVKDTIFTLVDGLLSKEDPAGEYPRIIEEAFQVYECSWVRELDGAESDVVRESYEPPYRDFNGITSEHGAHFILRVERILMKERYHKAIIRGASRFTYPMVPVDYGYRDNRGFWYSRFRKPRFEPVPRNKGVDVSVVMYAADRIDDTVKFTEEACAKLVKVPRVFLNTVLSSCVRWAKENDVLLVTAEHMDTINDKRAREKSR
jgi:flavin reductase (DIM6/NTAB) family NADH-FMN oxidoreductase RutF